MRLSRLAAPLLLLTLGGAGPCSDDEEPERPEEPAVFRSWEFTRFSRNGGASLAEPAGMLLGGVAAATHDYGPMLIFPPEVELDAKGEIFSNETGFTYWARTQAPHVSSPAPTAIVGSGATLAQAQRFRKTDANATLTFEITQAFLDAIDSNGGVPAAFECPWRAGQDVQACRRVMQAWVDVKISAVRVDADETFFTTGGTVELTGWAADFGYDVTSDRGRRLWTRDAFDFDPDVTGTGGTRGQVTLAGPIVVVVPLASVAVGEELAVTTSVVAGAINLRQRESYLSAAFRDPAVASGLEVTTAGLERLPTPTEPPAHPPLAPAPACAGPADPLGGTLALATTAIASPELPGPGPAVVVTRTGGTRGRVSARLVAAGGSATVGADLATVDTVVVFEDGEGGEQTVRVPILVDDRQEPDETVTLALSDARGCAALGAPTAATLTILDDDTMVQGATYTVGGTVSGLEGSGLVLREVKSGFDLTPAGDGPFTFSYQHPDGSDYEVRVITQPHDPFQVCSVAGGAGEIAGASVTSVAVTCTRVVANGALDPGFGEGGKVAGGITDVTALALQPDGKIVTVGKKTLARFLPDGRPDPDFGSGGTVTVSFGALVEQLNAVAVQPDGKIVVAGQTRSATTSDDFAVARFLGGGAPDTGFGSGGKVVTDFAGLADRAWAVMIAADGSVIAAGHAARSGDSDFAAVRYSATGVLDETFGKVTVDIAGNTDLAAAAAQQPDGKIVIVGRVARGGGDNPDVGIVRLLPGGGRDPDFGSGGVVRRAVIDGWDEATDVVIAPDGKIVVAVKAQVGVLFELAAARFTAAGAPDAGFGSGGFVSTRFSAKNDFATGLALDGAGRVVVVGQTSNLELPDFAIARYTTAGVLDASFGDGGKLSVDFFAAQDGAECVAVQPDGKILVGGVARSGATVGGAVIRVLP